MSKPASEFISINDASMAVFHGPRKLAVYDQKGMLIEDFRQLASSQQ